MKIPVQVTFHGTPVVDDIESACLQEAEKLERYFDRITRCEVTVERESPKHQSGSHWKIHVRVTVPGEEINVSRRPKDRKADERADVAIRETFDRVRRQLQDHARKVADH